MAYFGSNNVIITNKAYLTDANVLPIQNGRYIVVEPTKELYYDTNGTRIKIRDIQIVEDPTALGELSDMVVKDMAYVVSTNTLYYYNGTTWAVVNNEVYVGTTPPTDGNYKVWINPDGEVITVVDNLTSTSNKDVLSGNQGRILNEKIISTQNDVDLLIVQRI